MMPGNFFQTGNSRYCLFSPEYRMSRSLHAVAQDLSMQAFHFVIFCISLPLALAALFPESLRQSRRDRRGLENSLPLTARHSVHPGLSTRHSIANEGIVRTSLRLLRRGPIEAEELFHSLSRSSSGSSSSLKSATSQPDLLGQPERQGGPTAGDSPHPRHQQQHAPGGREEGRRTWRQWRREVTPATLHALCRIGLGLVPTAIGLLLNRPQEQAALIRQEEARRADLHQAAIIRDRLAHLRATDPAQWAHVERVAMIISTRTGMDVQEVLPQILRSTVQVPTTVVFGGRPTPHGEQQQPLSAEDVAAQQRTMNEFHQRRQREEEFKDQVKGRTT